VAGVPAPSLTTTIVLVRFNKIATTILLKASFRIQIATLQFYSSLDETYGFKLPISNCL